MTKVFTHLTEREDVKGVWLHDLAADTIRAMFEHCEQMLSYDDLYQFIVPMDQAELAIFHEKCVEHYHAAVRSLHHCLAQLLRKGFAAEAYVTKDGPLSLYVQEGDVFVFGIIFHRDRSYDDTPFAGRYGDWSCHS
jgi:hypothetical protein